MLDIKMRAQLNFCLTKIMIIILLKSTLDSKYIHVKTNKNRLKFD
jgi:hypothetical protein